jgi:hypothetical protein
MVGMKDVSLILVGVAIALTVLYGLKWAKAKYVAWRASRPASLVQRVEAIEAKLEAKAKAEAEALAAKV